MKNKIPFSLLPFNLLRRASQKFLGLGSKLKRFFPMLQLYLEQSEINLNSQEYIAMSITASLMSFVFLNLVLSTLLFVADVDKAVLISIITSIPIILFIIFQQVLYPKVVAGKKIKSIDKNLLPALQDMSVQLNSGITLFNILVSLSSKNYGEVSKEFDKAIKKINAGVPHIEVLDEMASKNPSIYFRRAIWQLVNGMKTGSDTGIVLDEIISSLSEEQLIQVQKYGGQLNPLAMFYMLITVILPSLGITFLIIISSFISASELLTKAIFWGLYLFVLFFQIIFLGLIKTKRPTLLER